MSALHVLEVEALVGLFVFGLAYAAITTLIWHLSRASEKRQLQRAAEEERSAQRS